MDLNELFNQVSQRMLVDFESTKTSLKHSGSKGASNEEIVKNFLIQYLPKGLGITSGQAIDSNGASSKQLDIIIYDELKTPVFFQTADLKVLPIECIYAVIEVKSMLNKSELKKSYENMLSVKKLEKTAYFNSNSEIQSTHNLYGRCWENWPVAHFVFAFDSIGLESLEESFLELHSNSQIHQRIDSICILKKGVFLNQDIDGQLSALPGPSTILAVSHTKKPLFLFYSIISVILNQAQMKPLNFQRYLSQVRF
ncbi:DUF6602 domain-containing protein [Psychrosphaera haliotis]|uniref:DUF6602 domain-containing protein n=1 Tax=Psychrosphaera haliotis TaxID=555083 RepID=A0A6N8FC07_9GAMM|nr:DUF6602 domain-containing protein [Psychrosphaera haliotis]MUH73634.1 hypothetical protein [Psychrosphaera haliotis]